MRKISIVCVGKLKESWLREGCQEYMKRLNAWCTPQVMELEEFRLPERPSPAQIEECIQKEGERILKKLPTSGSVVAMCVEGKLLSSESLAAYLEKTALSGSGDVTFVIGGSYGLWQQVKDKADLRLSISPMTFPHQLARVLLLEQIYRGFSINANAKYHK